MAETGDRIDDFVLGPVRVIVRYSCVRRDQYELLSDAPFPASLQARLGALGVLRGAANLYTVDVEKTHQLTVAPQRGRMVIMPRLSVERADQRRSAIEVVRLLAEELEKG